MERMPSEKYLSNMLVCLNVLVQYKPSNAAKPTLYLSFCALQVYLELLKPEYATSYSSDVLPLVLAVAQGLWSFCSKLINSLYIP
ncbi:hypothetical protein XELAEV_18026264mg [Xenopus laevis]|uniref:Uncharacterized protein n=1 Tax=Xenopus laevis TaxID=8355 RepID=A0A974CTI2_XENLA|nr:hypothetical protein XELAEV_18026264mg [Xenopus laevis]